MSKKRGRPRKECTKNKQCKFWTTEDDLRELDMICELSNVNRSEFIRKAVRSQINLAKFRLDL